MSTVDPGKLETEKIGRLLWQYSVPAVVATMATSLYNVVDRVFIGQGAGSMAISGLALCFPIMTLIQAFGTLVGVGASSKISIVLGMNDKDWAERILGNAILLTFVIWACICTSCLFFLDPLLRLFGGSEQTIPYASAYLKIIIPGSIFSNLAYSYSNIIRASGSPGKSMQFMLIGVGANVILDPLFIFGLNMVIEGAAYATVITMFISACFTMQFFMGQKTYIRFHRQKIRMRSSTIKDIVSIGLSPFLMNVAASVVNIILNNKLHNYGGDLAIGAYGIINSYAILFVM
ncbi:MAG: MATE family efflux transporter, partial [Bacteroidales bacterium]